MNNKSILTIALSFLFLCSCKDGIKSNNPFFSEYQTPFQIPPFDKIDATHYMPAFIEGIKQHNAEIEAIVNNSAEADFENTILAFDKSGLMLSRVSYVFYFMSEAYTNDQLDSVSEEINPMISKHYDDIMMNAKLFRKIKTVYEKRNSSKLDASQIHVIEIYYSDFERGGTNLSKEDQEKLSKINQELSVSKSTFIKNVLAETNDNFQLVIEDKKDLDGLPQNVIDGAADAAKVKKMEGKWVFGLSRASMTPFLQYANNRELREKIYRAYVMRGNNGNKNDNKEIAAKIAKLRCEEAQLFDFNTYAEYNINNNMAKTPEKVSEFLMKLWNSALPVAKNEVIEMQKIIDKEGGKFKLQPWDWWFYAEKLRKEKYDLDENELRPYFSITNVRDGMFDVATKLYGITFNKLTNIPVYHPKAEAYEVKEKNGKHLGIFYFGSNPASVGNDGWTGVFQNASWRDGKKNNPIVSVECNFTKPVGDIPSLLSSNETSVLFHEFGHALQVLFSESKYDRTVGDMTRDYIELPSQIMENWAFEPEVLKSYARHYKTGEAIPDQLVEKISKSRLFNQGFIIVEDLAACFLDLAYYNITEPKLLNIEEFEKQTMGKIGLIPEILPRYRTTNFLHIFEGPYAANFYAYTWAQVLDADAFEAFKESGNLYNPELAAKFRKFCLTEIGEGECMDQYRKFRGKDPSVEPLLKRLGFILN